MQKKLSSSTVVVTVMVRALVASTLWLAACGGHTGGNSGDAGGGGSTSPNSTLDPVGGCFYTAALGDFSDDPVWGNKPPGSVTGPRSVGDVCSAVTQKDCTVVSGGKGERFEQGGCAPGWIARCPAGGQQKAEMRLYESPASKSVAGGVAFQKEAFIAGCKAAGSVAELAN